MDEEWQGGRIWTKGRRINEERDRDGVGTEVEEEVEGRG